MQVTKQLLDEFESEYPPHSEIYYCEHTGRYLADKDVHFKTAQVFNFGLEVWLKQRDKVWRVYDVASWGIRHVARANYPHREYEAIKRLQQAVQASQPQEQGE